MKKYIFLSVGVLLVALACFVLSANQKPKLETEPSSTVTGSSQSTAEFDELFKPYQAVLDSLNEEYNTTLQFMGDRTTTDQPIFEQTLDEFREDCLKYIRDMEELSSAMNEDGVIDLTDPENSHLFSEKDPTLSSE